MIRFDKYLYLLLLFAMPQAFAVENIAHRGFSGRHLENSLRAVTNSWGAGATMVEVDLRLTGDGQLVLFHDAEYRKRAVNTVSLKELELLSGLDLITLPELFEGLPPNGILLLDLKDFSSAFCTTLVEAVQASELSLDRLFFQSRSFIALDKVERALPGARCLWVTSLKKEWLGMVNPSAIAIAKRLSQRKYYGVSAKGRQFVDTEFVHAFKEQGLRYFVWTINERDRMNHYKALGVDGIITDWPDKVSELSHP